MLRIDLHALLKSLGLFGSACLAAKSSDILTVGYPARQRLTSLSARVRREVTERTVKKKPFYPNKLCIEGLSTSCSKFLKVLLQSCSKNPESCFFYLESCSFWSKSCSKVAFLLKMFLIIIFIIFILPQDKQTTRASL